MIAEGQKQAQILEAEGLKQSEILKAEGEARAQKANAESETIRLVSDAFKGTGDPTNYLIATRYIDTLSHMVSGFPMKRQESYPPLGGSRNYSREK
ncbi:MAG: hypothetical protein JEY71_17945 [Sphaerochaeta sp.]|nr:hypothetical protein [Sphaerochaeta sp.]